MEVFFSCVADDVSVVELKRSTMMQRLSGWMPTAIRGDHATGDVVLSLAVREVENGSFLFALCQDHKLRMWSITDKVIMGCCVTELHSVQVPIRAVCTVQLDSLVFYVFNIAVILPAETFLEREQLDN